MATRLLLRSLRRPLPPPPGSSSGANLASVFGKNRLVGLLHRSPGALNFHVLPRIGNSRSGGGSPRRILGAFTNVSFVCFSAIPLLNGNESDGTPDLSKPGLPPMGPQDHGTNEEKRHWSRTDVFIAANLCKVHAVDAVRNRKLLMWGIKDNALIKKGQIWRLATSSLLHGGLFHLAVNAYSLHVVGPEVEEATGPRRFLAIYCTSALAGLFLFHCYLFSVGAQAVYVWRNQKYLENAEETLKDIRYDVLINLGIGLFLFRRIDNWAHLGGFLGGAAVEWFVGPNWNEHHVAEDGTVVFKDRAPFAQLMNSIRPQ
ncbi:hypothetical protein BRADI_2g19550v3 [Brachypodium distachyon]|uniref:Peptidase S54 rhomboid domain-containing protein n=1 Tax=Brachypodium distachyon TaxID=15368 RepID=A0A0Q3QVI4_BRADI|nr:hypothetical protein BRADI_2g19550v3 [Brachypodium distachyon]